MKQHSNAQSKTQDTVDQAVELTVPGTGFLCFDGRPVITSAILSNGMVSFRADDWPENFSYSSRAQEWEFRFGETRLTDFDFEHSLEVVLVEGADSEGRDDQWKLSDVARTSSTWTDLLEENQRNPDGSPNAKSVTSPAGHEIPALVMSQCDCCDEPAVAEMPQSSDQGATVRMVKCCTAHRAGWWDGADWNGRHLDVDLPLNSIAVRFVTRWEEGSVECSASLDLGTGVVFKPAQSDEGESHKALIGEYVLIGTREVSVELAPDNTYRIDAATMAAIRVDISDAQGTLHYGAGPANLQEHGGTTLTPSGRFIIDAQYRKIAEMYQFGESPAETEALKQRLIGSFNVLPALVGVLLRADKEGGLWQALFNEDVTDEYNVALAQALKALGKAGIADLARRYEIDALAVLAKLELEAQGV